MAMAGEPSGRGGGPRMPRNAFLTVHATHAAVRAPLRQLFGSS